MSVGTDAGQWVRRRCYSKVHVKSWTIFLEKDGYVKCFFQNCKFMAFDVEEMAKHYSLCGGNGCPDAKYTCPSCEGCTVSYQKLQLHMTRAHNINIGTTDHTAADNDHESLEEVTTIEKEKLPLSKVLILSWRCSFEKNKFIKCSDCSTLVTDVDCLIRHYPECKKVPISACYVCEHCMGRALDINFLACHMIVAHDKTIDYTNYNEITPQMVRFWEDEMQRKKFSYCLHKTNGENDCLFFEMDIISLILHVQYCQGMKPSDRHVCLYCGCWTTTSDKLQKHIDQCHTDPLGTLIFASESARKQIASNSMEISDYKQYPLCKKEIKKVNLNTGYNLFDELADVDRDGYCEEKENETSGHEEYQQVQILGGHKEYSSRKNKTLQKNSSSFSTLPGISHNDAEDRSIASNVITCIKDAKLCVKSHVQNSSSELESEHLLPTVQSSDFDSKFKKGLNLVIDGNVYSSSESFVGANQNTGGSNKQVELIIPESNLEVSNLENNDHVVLSKLSVMHKDGTFQVIPQGTKSETNKSHVNDIFHLKDGCVVEVTLCGGEMALPSSNILSCTVESTKKHAGTQIDCLNGTDTNIEHVQGLASSNSDSNSPEVCNVNNSEDVQMTNICNKSIPIQKNNIADSNLIQVGNVNVIQDIPKRKLKHLSTSTSIVSEQNNFCKDSLENPMRIDHPMQSTEPVLNELTTLENKLTNTNIIEVPSYEAKTSQESENKATSKGLVAESSGKIKSFISDNTLQVKDFVTLDFQGDEPAVGTEGTNTSKKNILISPISPIKQNTLDVKNKSQGNTSRVDENYIEKLENDISVQRTSHANENLNEEAERKSEAQTNKINEMKTQFVAEELALEDINCMEYVVKSDVTETEKMHQVQEKNISEHNKELSSSGTLCQENANVCIKQTVSKPPGVQCHKTVEVTKSGFKNEQHLILKEKCVPNQQENKTNETKRGKLDSAEHRDNVTTNVVPGVTLNMSEEDISQGFISTSENLKPAKPNTADVKNLKQDVISVECVENHRKLAADTQNIDETVTSEYEVNILLSDGSVLEHDKNPLHVVEIKNKYTGAVKNDKADTEIASGSVFVQKSVRHKQFTKPNITVTQNPVEFEGKHNSFVTDNSLRNMDVTDNSLPDMDVTDNSLPNMDVTDNSLPNMDVTENSLPNMDVTENSLPNMDVTDNSLPNMDVTDNSLPNMDVTDNSLPNMDVELISSSSEANILDCKNSCSSTEQIACASNTENHEHTSNSSTCSSNIDVNVLNIDNVNQNLTISEQQIVCKKTSNCDLKPELSITECPSITKKKRGRPPKRKLVQFNSKDVDPVSVKKLFEADKSDININVTELPDVEQSVSFTDEHNETCDSDLQLLSQSELSSLTNDTEKSKTDENVIKLSNFEQSVSKEEMIDSSRTFKTECNLIPRKKKGRPPKKHVAHDGVESQNPNDVNKGNSFGTGNSVSSFKVDGHVSETSSVKQPLVSTEVNMTNYCKISDGDFQLETSDLVCPSKTKKKRGRPPRKEKNIELVTSDISNSSNNTLPLDRKSRYTRRVDCSSVNEMVASDSICKKWYLHPNDSTNHTTNDRKRGRPTKANDNMFVHFMASNQDTGTEVVEEIAVKNKKIDRRFKCNRVPTDNATIQPRIQLKDSIMVKCGRCGEEMSKLMYQTSHELKHNYLCWLEGEEPVDFSDQSSLLKILNTRRKNKKLAYKCEECGISKRSAVGFLSHIQFCGKSAEEREAMMLRCEICGRIMMPASLKVHMGQAHNPKKPVPEEQEPLTFVKGRRAAASKAELTFHNANNDEDDDGDTAKRRRSSSPLDDSVRRLYTRPFTRVSNGQVAFWKKHIGEKGFGNCYSPCCTFVGKTIKVLQDHDKECKFKPTKVYSCRKCHYSTEKEDEMIEHVKEKHDAFLNQDNLPSNSSGSESDSGQALNSNKRSYPKLKFIRKLSRQQRHKYLHQALTWTYDMRLKMNSKSQLYNEFQYKACDWVPMSHEMAENYLPSTKTSIQVMINSQDWKQLELFEGTIVNGTPAMFVGGPIWACAWAPVPDMETHQYMAVACHPDMDAEHAMGCTYTYKSIIQIWDFGDLSNIEDSPVKVAPRLMLAIAHNHGVVWALEWCHSGCFNSSQLGLLAAACSDGSVVIHSIPRHKPSESHIVYKVKLAAVLKLGCEMLTQCTRMSWNKVSPHNILAGGFANGMVALWDLNTTSTLLRTDDIIFPYCVFQAHNSSITGLSFSPGEEVRYISTASADRANKFWDLQDTTAPVSVNRKGAVTDSTWLPHWLCAVNVYDDVYGYGSTNVSLFAYRDFFFQPYPMAPQLAVNWSLAHCEWLNAICTCDETGRVNVSFPLQLIHMDDKKGRKTSQNIILTSIQDFGAVEEVNITDSTVDNKPKKAKQKGNNIKESASFLETSFATDLKKYNEMASRFGLSLSIDNTNEGINMPKKEIDPANYINSYPLSSVNKVSWNPNYKSFLWIAAGFQCGLMLVPRMNYIRRQDLITFYTKNET